MAKEKGGKKGRNKFRVDGFEHLIDEHYDSDTDAIKKLDTNAHTLKKLKEGTGVKKSTALKVLKRHRDTKDNSFDPHSAIKEIK